MPEVAKLARKPESKLLRSPSWTFTLAGSALSCDPGKRNQHRWHSHDRRLHRIPDDGPDSETVIHNADIARLKLDRTYSRILSCTSPLTADARETLHLTNCFAMSRVDQLRISLTRCRDRSAYCERQLADFAESADLSDPHQQRALQKLRFDLQLAESDVRSLQIQLDDLMD